MLIKLVVLIIPAVILFGVLYTGNKGDGIGGGGYDLSEMVYSGIFTLFVICWNAWIIASLIMAKTASDKHNGKVLLSIGIIVLISTIIWFVRFLR